MCKHQIQPQNLDCFVCIGISANSALANPAQLKLKATNQCLEAVEAGISKLPTETEDYKSIVRSSGVEARPNSHQSSLNSRSCPQLSPAQDPQTCQPQKLSLKL